MEEFEPVESRTKDVLDEGRTVISVKRLDPVHAKYIGERMNKTDNRLGILLEMFNKERERFVRLCLYTGLLRFTFARVLSHFPFEQH